MERKTAKGLEVRPLETEREWTVEGIPVLRMTVTLPQPVGEDRVSRRIRRFYRWQGRCFLRYCQGELLPRAEAEGRAALAASVPVECFRAELGYRVTYQAGSLWSLYTQARETDPSGPSLLRRWGDTWDLAAGFPAPLGAFLPPRERGKREIFAAAETEIRRQEAAGYARYHPGWRRKLRRTYSSRRFYLTEEGVAVFWPMYAIAPAAEGIPTFLLPYRGEPPLGPLR